MSTAIGAPADALASSTAASTTVAPADVALASSYSLSFDDLTDSTTSTGSLTNISVDAASDVTGNIVNAPVSGDSNLIGTLNGDNINFSTSPTEYFIGTVNASTGKISGTFFTDAFPDQNGIWTATPLTKAKPTTSLSVDAGANQTILGTNIITLDGQVDGDAADVAWTQASGPGTANFASSDSAATTATVSTPGTYVFQLTAEGDGTSASGQVTITVQAYVALGDSYSAGDGAVANPPTATSSDYLPGGSSLVPSSSGNASCLQSVHAHPELVDTYVSAPNPVPAGTANPAFTFDACTAAVIKEIAPDAQKAGDQNVPPQISALKEEPAASVGLVTLTIGGNDAGFGDVMGYCARRTILEQSCEGHSKAEVTEAINGDADVESLEARLQALYTQIKDVTNTGGQSPLAPGARIIVLGYPKFFPTGQASACPTGYLTRDFQPSDMAWIDNVIYQVDNAIQTAAAAAGVTYADTYNAFGGNELCQASPYLNDATLDSVGVELGIQSFHPTMAGQAELAAFAKGNGVSEASAAPRFTSIPSETTLFLGEPLRVESNDTFTATGNVPPSFTVTSGTLPNGLTLDPISGLISGTPAKKGSYMFQVTASNSAGSVTSATVKFLVL
jgi:GDSL-like Lipase/Acylhydrolase family/Putative Ig domain